MRLANAKDISSRGENHIPVVLTVQHHSGNHDHDGGVRPVRSSLGSPIKVMIFERAGGTCALKNHYLFTTTVTEYLSCQYH